MAKISPARFIVLGFLFIMTLGAFLLMLPISLRDGVSVSAVDAFFTATSAISVTGLLAVDTYDTFSPFGQTVVALLIQIGGLGVTSIGVGFIILAGKKVTFRERVMLKEALNIDSMKGIVKLVKSILFMTLCFELIGALLSFSVFSQHYPTLRAVGMSLFHSVAAFNNAGFDVVGNGMNLIPYQDNVIINLTTCFLIIFGGLGFLVIKEIINKRNFKKFTLHTKVVLTMTATLLIIGTVMLKLTEKDITWLGAFFFSTSARTAGFSTYALGNFKDIALFILMILMLMGASPGSTGGGIKTTTTFVIFKSVYATITNKDCMGFKRKIPADLITKSHNIATLFVIYISVAMFLMLLVDGDQFEFVHLLLEIISAFCTVGLSAGITGDLSELSKVILIVCMFVGRLGVFTMASIWYNKKISNISYSEEGISIG